MDVKPIIIKKPKPKKIKQIKIINTNDYIKTGLIKFN